MRRFTSKDPSRFIEGHLVRSSNGKRYYRVSYDVCRHSWVCSCPAGVHGKNCKHVNRVKASL